MNLIDEYKSRKKGCQEKKTINNRVATSLHLVAVFASAAATISSAVGTILNEIISVLAAIPGIVALVPSTFKPDARSQWWSEKYGKLDDLVRAMEREGMSESEAGKELTRFLEEHEQKYPGVGSPPSGSAA
jgi:hypothetical protein